MLQRLYTYPSPMPNVFKEMDPALAEKLVEGYENELLPEYEAQERRYAVQTCPECGGACEKTFLSLEHSMPRGAIVPRSGMKCTKCSCVFDPHSGLIIKPSEAAQERVESMRTSLHK